MPVDKENILSFEKLAWCDRVKTHEWLFYTKDGQVWRGYGDNFDMAVLTATRIN